MSTTPFISMFVGFIYLFIIFSFVFVVRFKTYRTSVMVCLCCVNWGSEVNAFRSVWIRGLGALTV